MKTKMLVDEHCVGTQKWQKFHIRICMENRLANIPTTYQSNGWISKSNANDQKPQAQTSEWVKRNWTNRQDDHSNAGVYVNKLFAYFWTHACVCVCSVKIKCVYFADISNIYQKFYLQKYSWSIYAHSGRKRERESAVYIMVNSSQRALKAMRFSMSFFVSTFSFLSSKQLKPLNRWILQHILNAKKWDGIASLCYILRLNWMRFTSLVVFFLRHPRRL